MTGPGLASSNAYSFLFSNANTSSSEAKALLDGQCTLWTLSLLLARQGFSTEKLWPIRLVAEPISSLTLVLNTALRFSFSPRSPSFYGGLFCQFEHSFCGVRINELTGRKLYYKTAVLLILHTLIEYTRGRVYARSNRQSATIQTRYLPSHTNGLFSKGGCLETALGGHLTQTI